MEPVIDFLAEEELKAAEQIMMQIFDVKPARQCRSAKDCKSTIEARKEGKHERIAKLVVSLRAKAARAGR